MSTKGTHIPDWLPVPFAGITPAPSQEKGQDLFPTGNWRAIRPVYRDKMPPCNNACGTNEKIQGYLDLVKRGKYLDAYALIKEDMPFPSVTGRVCYHPCEQACNRGQYDEAISIRAVERFLGDLGQALPRDVVKAGPPNGKKVAVVGSGPAGLAAAEQLSRAGHAVTVFEKADRIGGLLRYGIPEFKMEKRFLDRRLRLMEAAGIAFETGVHVGATLPVATLRTDFDAVVLAGGAEWPRDLEIPGRELSGIHFAMDYLTLQNRRSEGDSVPDGDFITAKDKDVVIIGGGDTGADCLGTVHRQGARSVTQFEILPRPPEERDADSNPWPLWPNIFRVSSAHEEGGAREYSVNTTHFSGADGRLTTLHAAGVEMVAEGGRMAFKNVPGTEHAMKADLVLLAMGFLGPRREGLLSDLGVRLTDRGNVWRDRNWMTSVPGVFAAGDIQRGQSLIVWAIAEGRSAARGVDLYLMGSSDLPAPLP